MSNTCRMRRCSRTDARCSPFDRSTSDAGAGVVANGEDEGLIARRDQGCGGRAVPCGTHADRSDGGGAVAGGVDSSEGDDRDGAGDSLRDRGGDGPLLYESRGEGAPDFGGPPCVLTRFTGDRRKPAPLTLLMVSVPLVESVADESEQEFIRLACGKPMGEVREFPSGTGLSRRCDQPWARSSLA